MAVFKYVTRGEQTAQGKQKTYFCAHPDDYGRYFDKIANEILDTLAKENNLNCAFFYLEDANAERDDDFKFSFKEMNLIVMPVTTRLLTTSNPALDIEFRLAAEYGIPVLPIMMESGLDDIFNEKCGDLQYLDPNSRDAAAVSYEEKLTKYLTSVLIGDELAEKIRKAFDAYIFLSYRKKDRKYAQELMRLIHQNEFCRDIAIWYDEFLTPGENFNDSIKEALEKSELFALAVTPSVLEKSIDKDGNECDNYIVSIEFPMAKQAKKNIVPAELVATDKNELSRIYENIPNCIDAHNGLLLSDALADALKNIAVRSNDSDPEHNFFIGLAYLQGIDVEQNREKAIELIASSAEAGLPEAIEKIASIYYEMIKNNRYGIGYASDDDFENWEKWQEKLIVCRKNDYDKIRDENTAEKYLLELQRIALMLIDEGYFLRKYISIERNPKKYYSTVKLKIWLTESEKINKRHSTSLTKRMIAQSSGLLGIYLIKYWYKALRFRKLIAFEDKTAQSGYELAECYMNIGCKYSRLKMYKLKHRRLFRVLAEAANRKGAQILYEISLNAEASGVQKDKLIAYQKLATYYDHLKGETINLYDGDLRANRENEYGEKAEKYSLKALEIAKSVACGNDTVESLEILADSYELCAECVHTLEVRKQYMDFRRFAMENYEKLCRLRPYVRKYKQHYEINHNIVCPKNKATGILGRILGSCDI